MNKLKMSLLINILLVISFLSCKKTSNDGIVPPPDGESVDSTTNIPGWKLVWNDEFSGTSVDLSKWNYQTGGSGWGNNELEHYTSRPENSYIENGNLIIEAREEKYGDNDYTSARMNTSRKGDWTYGRFDIRAKLPYGQGIWPAIWMMPTDGFYGGWPRSGEIDIMEMLGHDIWRMYGTIHFANSDGSHAQQGGSYTILHNNNTSSATSFAGSFHLFTVIWDSTGMKWYVDNNFSHSATIGKPFDKNFHIILNVAVGGNWPGNPNGTTTFPQRMVVDYVRAYTKE